MLCGSPRDPKRFVESANTAGQSAQKALLRMRLFSDNIQYISSLRLFDQLVVQIALEAVIFWAFSRFSQRYPQGFPQFLCKEGVALPEKTR
jgi:hypothetical protein